MTQLCATSIISSLYTRRSSDEEKMVIIVIIESIQWNSIVTQETALTTTYDNNLRQRILFIFRIAISPIFNAQLNNLSDSYDFHFVFSDISATSTMRRSRWKLSIILFTLNLAFKSLLAASSSQYNSNFKISPKTCAVSDVEGTCMFVWECIRSEGTHLGMCMDGFMFGSCCGHNLTDNFILPPSTPFLVKPTQPARPRPSKKPSKPSNSGTMTIHRPNGSGTLVIRQPQKPQKTTSTTTRKPTRKTTTTRSPIDNFNDQSNELSGAASVSTRKFFEFSFNVENNKKNISPQILWLGHHRQHGKWQPSQTLSRNLVHRHGTSQRRWDRNRNHPRSQSHMDPQRLWRKDL